MAAGLPGMEPYHVLDASGGLTPPPGGRLRRCPTCLLSHEAQSGETTRLSLTRRAVVQAA
jgi:hypothetical protein